MVLSRNFVKTGPDFLGKVVLWDIYAIILGGWGRRSSNLGTLSFYWERNARKDSGGRFTVLKSLVVSRYDFKQDSLTCFDHYILYVLSIHPITLHVSDNVFFHNTSSHCVCVPSNHTNILSYFHHLLFLLFT